MDRNAGDAFLSSPLGMAVAAYISKSGEGDDYGCNLGLLRRWSLDLGS